MPFLFLSSIYVVILYGCSLFVKSCWISYVICLIWNLFICLFIVSFFFFYVYLIFVMEVVISIGLWSLEIYFVSPWLGTMENLNKKKNHTLWFFRLKTVLEQILALPRFFTAVIWLATLWSYSVMARASMDGWSVWTSMARSWMGPELVSHISSSSFSLSLMGHEPGRLWLVVLHRRGFIYCYYPTIIRRARRELMPRSVINCL